MRTTGLMCMTDSRNCRSESSASNGERKLTAAVFHTSPIKHLGGSLVNIFMQCYRVDRDEEPVLAHISPSYQLVESSLPRPPPRVLCNKRATTIGARRRSHLDVYPRIQSSELFAPPARNFSAIFQAETIRRYGGTQLLGGLGHLERCASDRYTGKTDGQRSTCRNCRNRWMRRRWSWWTIRRRTWWGERS